MLPASNSSSRQPSRSPDNGPLPQDKPQTIPDQIPSKKKKGRNASGREAGTAKYAAREVKDVEPSFPTQQDDLFSQTQSPVPPPNNPVVSPVLKALGAAQDNDPVRRTDAWAQEVPFGKSPPVDHIDGAVIGESPPELSGRVERGFSHASPSASPRPTKTRPLSFGNGFMNATSSRNPSTDRQRHSLSAQYQNQPPPPHLPQPHFYSAPDIDIPMYPGQNVRSASEGTYSFSAFDNLPYSSPKMKMGGKVLLVGSDGRLDVLSLEKERTRLIGRIDGLNGRVIEAKLSSGAPRADPFASSRPHVVITLHGPVVQKDDNGGSSPGSDQNEMLPGIPMSKASEKQHKLEESSQFQTRVEVYSLQTQEHITTLFSSKPVSSLDAFSGLSLLAPPPVGNLRTYVDGNNVIIASGTSGEVFIFGVSFEFGAYQCFAKTWTSVQSRGTRRLSSSSNSTDQDNSQADSSHGPRFPDTPMVSVAGRWLAVVPPPSSSSRVSLHGAVPTFPMQKKPLGLDTHSPPSPPPVTCVVDSGEGESLLNKVARGVTQELFKSARWIGDQGLQTWNNYWNKDQQATHAPQRRSHPVDPQQGYQFFPPTHAQETAFTTHDEPDLVSIIDLKTIGEYKDAKTSILTPFATFQPPNGCSFLSFAPTGLLLLTASINGDVQYVWDLMQIRHCRAAAFISDDPASAGLTRNPSAVHVRQVARYSRLTTSSIVDVTWTAPTGDRFAIITRKGTVHVFDLPRSAFHWPPLRRIPHIPTNASGETERPVKEEFPEEVPSGNRFSAAMKLVGGKTQPILSAVRGRAPSVSSPFTAVGGFAISSATGAGGKVVAAGLSKSVGAAAGTVNTLRHVGENRLHISEFNKDPSPARVAWFGNRDQPLLGLVESDSFRMYKVLHSTTARKNYKQRQSVIGSKTVELRLPPQLQNPSGPAQVGFINKDLNITGFWTSPPSARNTAATSKLKSQPLSQAEIETNPPYQPFHTDRRVNLCVYTSESDDDLPDDKWVFGNDIRTTTLHFGQANYSDDDYDQDDDRAASGERASGTRMENLISVGNATGDVEHVVITTRRKRKQATTAPKGGDDDGFFEDDCEVLDFARDRV
ncbi:hypothetical protein FQN54_008265 [Arachnomyces sp. PD_36]|nr:hypothetical protein FQN54_008265 [Arachnomyces sp. PD_36]